MFFIIFNGTKTKLKMWSDAFVHLHTMISCTINLCVNIFMFFSIFFCYWHRKINVMPYFHKMRDLNWIQKKHTHTNMLTFMRSEVSATIKVHQKPFPCRIFTNKILFDVHLLFYDRIFLSSGLCRMRTWSTNPQNSVRKLPNRAGAYYVEDILFAASFFFLLRWSETITKLAVGSLSQLSLFFTLNSIESEIISSSYY